MAEGRTEQGGSAGTGTLSRTREEASQNGGTNRLKEELEDYIEARLSLMLQNVGHGLGEGARRLGDMSAGTLTSTASHAKDALVDKAKDATGMAKDAVTDKAKDLTGKKKRGKPPAGGGKGHTIIEDIDVGVPVREAYDQWTQFREFQRFAKGVVGVEQVDDVMTNWHVKVAKVNRRWRGTITEQVPDERLVWTSEGEKATTRGVVTFHPLGENLTKVLLVLEYFPKGVVERVGGLFRAQGRRARLDLKLYRTFVMTRGEATGGWRGEIRDGEVQEPEAADEDRDEGEDGEPEGPEETEDRREDDKDAADEYDDDEEDLEEDEEDEEDEDENEPTDKTEADDETEADDDTADDEDEDNYGSEAGEGRDASDDVADADEEEDEGEERQDEDEEEEDGDGEDEGREKAGSSEP
ncbi:SRPBCC family protein [Streptomyces sp. NPDC012510]|uniref:SRPBCC family protein n=1 Tax=Streptomyces sp. NPDC012510 TaxID=3364838 RepID=UPI0036E9EDDA